MSKHADFARALYEARRTRTPIEPLSTTDPELAVDDAYQIQRGFVELLQADGAGDVVGYKLGLTSVAMQQLIGVDEPDYGPVLASMVYEDGVTVDLDDLIHPKVEAEIALTLREPLRGPGVSRDDALAAIGGAVAAIELVDSRVVDWRIKLVDTVSDLASSAATAKNPRVVPLDFDVRLTGMVITKNDEVMATGAGAAALGDPVYAVAWLANTLGPYGVTLEAGQFVMTGSLHSAFDVIPGDVVVADFDRLGSVSMKFAGASQ